LDQVIKTLIFHTLLNPESNCGNWFVQFGWDDDATHEPSGNKKYLPMQIKKKEKHTLEK